MPIGRKYNINGLNEKQERFCIEYVKTLNAKQAYEKAGYTGKKENVKGVQISRLLAKPEIKNRIQELSNMTAKTEIMNNEQIRERLTQIALQQLDEEVLMSVLKGDRSEIEKHKKKGDLRTALKALELLGKSSGMFTEQYKIDGGVQVVVKDDLEE